VILLRAIIVNYFCWWAAACCRFVIPLLPREATGNLDDLTLHSVGVLEVRGMNRDE